MKRKDEIKHLIISVVISLGGHYHSNEELHEITKSDFNNKNEVRNLLERWIYSRWQLNDVETKIKIMEALEISLNDPKFDFEEISNRAELPLEQSYKVRQLFVWLYEYLKEIEYI